MKNTTVAQTPAQIQAFRCLALRSALRLEISGMRHSRGVNTHASIKKEFNLKGDRIQVFTDFSEMLVAWGMLDAFSDAGGKAFVRRHKEQLAAKRAKLNAAMPKEDPLKAQEYAEEVASGQHDGAL